MPLSWFRSLAVAGSDTLRSVPVRVRVIVVAAVGVAGVIALGLANQVSRTAQHRSEQVVARYAAAQAQANDVLMKLPLVHARFFDMLRKANGSGEEALRQAMDALSASVAQLRLLDAELGMAQHARVIESAHAELVSRIEATLQALAGLGSPETGGTAATFAARTAALERALQEEVNKGFSPTLQRVSIQLQTIMKHVARYMRALDEPTENAIMLGVSRLGNELRRLDLDGDANEILSRGLKEMDDAFEAWKVGAKGLAAATDNADWTFAKVAEPIEAMRAEIDARVSALREGAAETQRRSALFDTLAVVVIGLCCALVAWAVAASITGPLSRLGEAMQRLSAGDTVLDIAEARHRDEFGAMARTLEVFRDNAIERADLMAREVAEAKARGDRARSNDAAVAEFGHTVSGVMATLDGAAARLAEASGMLGEVARAAAARTDAARNAASDMAMRIGMVAGATDELSSSIAEVTHSTRQSADSADAALEQVEATRKRMALLNQTAERIGEVVSLIQAIASQTNLLALNATIEAARAGEAGRGFAVVAQEVKALAAQTRSATEEIARQVNAIQGETHGVSQAVDSMAGAVERLREVALHVAGAINQQESTITEIASAMGEISQGAEASASAADAAGQASAQASLVSAQIDEISAALNGSARELAGNVQGFIARVRAT